MAKNPYSDVIKELLEFAAKATTSRARGSLLLLAEAYRNLGLRAAEQRLTEPILASADPRMH